MIESLTSALRQRLLKFLGIDAILTDIEEIKEAVVEHDKAISLSTIVQIKIANEVMQQREHVTKKSIKKKVDDDDLVN